MDRRVSAEDVQAAVQRHLPLDAYGIVTLKPAPKASLQQEISSEPVPLESAEA